MPDSRPGLHIQPWPIVLPAASTPVTLGPPSLGDKLVVKCLLGKSPPWYFPCIATLDPSQTNLVGTSSPFTEGKTQAQKGKLFKEGCTVKEGLSLQEQVHAERTMPRVGAMHAKQLLVCMNPGPSLLVS